MSYAKLYLQKSNRIPTVFVLIIIILIFVFFIRVFNNSSIPSKASNIDLKRIEITNLTPSQVSIYWQTGQKETGWIIYGKKGEEMNLSGFDDRDIIANKFQYFYHHVTLKNLLPQTTYQFKLVANNKLLDSKSVFSFTTPKQYILKNNLPPVYGKVIKPNNNPTENAIVMLEFANSYPLTAITKSTGEWLIPMYAVYQKDSIQQKSIQPKDRVSINILTDSGQSSQIDGLYDKMSPLPQTIVIGSNYNFGDGSQVLGAVDKISSTNQTKVFYIIYPQEGGLIPGFTPLIKGKAPSNIDILVTIQGNGRTYAAKTRSNSEGAWEYKMKERLIIGKYILTAEVREGNGNTLVDQRSFLIIANEGNDARVLGVASGEPTLVPTKTLPSPTPTLYVVPTTSSATTSGTQPPVPGSSHWATVVSGASLLILGLGILLAF